MTRKILKIGIALLLIILIIVPTLFAATTKTKNDVTLVKVDDKTCTINLNDKSTLTKKLISVDDSKKEALLQIDVVNGAQREETITPSEVVIVLDNSASMQRKYSDGTNRQQRVYEAAKSLANYLIDANSETRVGIVRFSTSARSEVNPDTGLTVYPEEGTLQGDASVVKTLTNNKTELSNAIDAIVADGPRTNIDAGLQMAETVFSNSNKNKFMVVMTDGVPNTAVGGPLLKYSGQVATKTKATLDRIIGKGIKVITTMTGIDNTEVPVSSISSETAITTTPITYRMLAEEVFGTNQNPYPNAESARVYYIQDTPEEINRNVSQIVNKDFKVVKENKITNIVIKDYFPAKIVENYDFEIVKQANIGNVTATINASDRSITWNIETLNPGETATIQYKLKLKDEFNNSIIDEVLPTNENVTVTYTDTDGGSGNKESKDSPTIKLIAKDEKPADPPSNPPVDPPDDTVAPEPTIPQLGARPILTFSISTVLLAAVTFFAYKSKNIK